MPLLAETTTTAMIAAGAVVFGAVAGVAGTLLTTRGKLAEIELTYRQAAADAHLLAARQHTETLYLPLNSALSTLLDAFLLLREHTNTDDGANIEHPLAAFRLASADFLRTVQTITGSGQDAFLTTELDGRLRDFVAFLRASQNASAVTGKLVFQTFLPFIGLAGQAVDVALGGGLFRVVSVAKLLNAFSLSVGTTIEADEVIVAPLQSRDFEKRLQRDVAAMKASIRDVTLGRA
jgi:hypothetical protein